jgi:hypothetical protein
VKSQIYHRLLWSSVLVLSSLAATISIALAETKEKSFILNSDGTQSFNVLIQSAQELAKSSIEKEFIESSDTTEVSITILIEHNGQIVPILNSKVSRSQWQRDSRLYRWTRYFGSSGVLLGFYAPSASPTPKVASGQVIVPRKLRNEKDPAFRDD